MSLFDGQPIDPEEVRARLLCASDGPTVRRISKSGKVYTVRHRPWAELVGVGPEGYTCGDCHWLKRIAYSKTYYKCGRQIQTAGAGTDIRVSDPACRLWHIPGVSMFTVKGDREL